MRIIKNKIYGILIITSLVISINACKKDSSSTTNNQTPTTTPPYQSGVFIVNEGPFQTGSGTITFNDRAGNTVNDVFQKENNRPLGNIVQSIEIFNNKAYIVVNNAGKVEVADAGTFKSSGVINALQAPRYFIGINSGKGYISDWSSGAKTGNIKVIDLATLAITKTIPTGANPDKMLLMGNKLFVLNSAGWTNDSTITVIDSQNDAPLQTVVVGKNPSGIVKDINGKIWILCAGINDYTNASNSTPGRLLRLNPNNYSIEYSYDFPSNAIHPTKLCTNTTGNILYFIYGNGVSAYNVTNPEITPVIYRSNIYGLGYDTKTNYLYLTDPKDYSSSGWVIRYNSSSGLPVDSFKAGIIPGEIFFK